MGTIDLLYIMLLLAAVNVVFAKKIIHSLLFLSMFSMFLALKYITLRAPDVAITEAALGTGLTTLVYLVAIKKTRSKRHD